MFIDEIRDALGTEPQFWQKLHRSLDAIGFTEDYANAFKPPATPSRAKYFKDSIWGMIEFSSDEVAIIDCPLLQRLRQVHQLGFTFLTYPSAEHSRFSHTLGVAHVVKRLIKSIAAVAQQNTSLRAGGEEYQYYNPEAADQREIIRSLIHASLLHDCGHLAFSHAGEAALMANANSSKIGGYLLEDFLQIFRDATFQSNLSECLSIALCLSPRFEAFYAKIVAPGDARARINEICSFIGGISHTVSFPGLANIISGAAVDADKIDYINRDAKECGIPVGVDVSRAFLNSAIINISESQAKKLSESRKSTDINSGADRFLPGWHFIVNSTGVDTYDELANARAILYNRVYLHQLTRNAEQVLAAAIRLRSGTPGLPGNPAPEDVFSWFEFGDFSLLSSLAKQEETAGLAKRLTFRRLPKRAFVLFRDVCEPFVSLEHLFDGRQWAKPTLEELDAVFARRTAWKLFDGIVPLDPTDSPIRMEEFRVKVRNYAIDARKLIDSKFAPQKLADDEPFVGFAPRNKQNPIPEVLVREKSSIGFSSAWSKSDELTSADSVGRGLDYLYADDDWLVYVAIACAKVLFDFHAERARSALLDEDAPGDSYESAKFELIPRLKLRLENICSRIGLDFSKLVSTMHKLALRDYFDGVERIVPLKNALQRHCREIATKYSQLHGEKGWHVTEQSVEAFVRQFPVNVREEIIALLKKGKMIDRLLTRTAMDNIISGAAKKIGKPLLICRFSPNSGNFIGMILEQERLEQYHNQGHRFLRSLAELEVELEKGTDVCVVFIDDQFASGSQAHAQILQWAGLDRIKWPKEIQGEQNIDRSRPGPRTTRFLKEGHFILAFVFGTDAGKKRIVKAAKKQGFMNIGVVYDQNLAPESKTISDELRFFLEKVGMSVLRKVRFGDQHTTPQQERALRKDALGYGGSTSIIVTPFGAPSHTITAFWCPGTFQNQAWVPLFLRRGYRKHLVLS